MEPDLSQLFSPRSIAIVGASREKKKIGNIVVENLIELGYKGDIYLVNPKAKEIAGLKVYEDYLSLPAVPELAIISLPAEVVLKVIPSIAEKGTKNLVIFSSGFKEEKGNEGTIRERQLMALAQQFDLHILGPNCLGFVNMSARLNATFGRVADVAGNLRFLSQSGAIATSIFDFSEFAGLGFSEFVTLGNKTVVNESDVLSYWLENLQDAQAAKLYEQQGLSGYQPIGMYLESIVDGLKFMHVCRQLSNTNPVFVLKPGKSKGAQKAMQSHTGAIAGEDAVLEAALLRSGVIRCNGIEDVFDLCRLCAWENAPAGPRVAVVSNAGGPAVITSDFIDEAGLELAPLSEETQRKLEECLPRAASIMNPIDVLGDAMADRYGSAVDIALAESAVDALVVILTPQVMTEIQKTAEVIGKLSKKYNKPVVCSFMGGQLIGRGEKVLNECKIPSFRYPERAIMALGKLWWWHSHFYDSLSEQETKENELIIKQKTRSYELILQLLTEAESQERPALTAIEANELLALAELPTPAGEEVTSFQQAKAFVKDHRWPVVVKLSSATVLHKQDQGGVKMDISTEKELGEAITVLQHVVSNLQQKGDQTSGIMLQKQVEKGIEVIVGVKRDNSFGHVVMFGAGGTMAELIRDRNLALLPFNKAEAIRLIQGSKVHTLLAGFRGDSPYAIEPLAELMVKLVSVAYTFPSIKEIEINPVIVTHKKVWAVDGRVLIHS